MLIKEWMSPDPVTISPDTPVMQAEDMMKKGGFRRIPVLDGSNLVGIVTDRDLKDASPSDANTLSIYELNYLISQLTVKEVMTKNVMTVAPDEPIELAAMMMEEHKLGGLPVVEGGRVVGVITVTDVLRAFIKILALREGKALATHV